MKVYKIRSNYLNKIINSKNNINENNENFYDSSNNIIISSKKEPDSNFQNIYERRGLNDKRIVLRNLPIKKSLKRKIVNKHKKKTNIKPSLREFLSRRFR